MRKVALLLGMFALTDCAEKTIYLRTDGQDMVGNSALHEQFELDRVTCQTDPGDTRDCMAVKGYVAVPKDQAAAKQRQLAAIAAQTRSKKPSPSRLRCDQQHRLKAWRVRSRNQSRRRSRRRRRRTDRAGLAGARARSRLRRVILRRCFGPVAALQYSRPVAQDHQTFWIIFNGGFVERARRSQAVVLHEYAFDAGALATIVE